MSCCWDSLCVTECDISNVELPSNTGRSFAQAWWRMWQGYNSTSGLFLVDSVSTSTISERYVLELQVQERNWSAHFYTNSEKQTPWVRIKCQETAIPLLLTKQHTQDRLDFVRTHTRWTIRDWTPVLFTDESRCCLDFTDRRQLV